MTSKLKAIGPLLLTGALLPACESDSVTAVQQANIVVSGQRTTPVRILPDNAFDRFEFDRYRLLSMHTEGDELVLLVSVVGECVVHEFNLLARDRFGIFTGSSVPGTQASGKFTPPGVTWPPASEAPLPKLSLVLSHDDRGDLCRDRQFEELRFDLTPIRRAFEREFGTDRGSLVLTLSVGRILYIFPTVSAA